MRIGIIGVGGIGGHHAVTYRKIPEARVDALADADPGCLAEAAAELGVTRTYGDYRDLLGDPGIDAVNVCVPNFLHSEVACAALEAGKHVLLEKPMATTVKEAQDIVACARKTGRILMVGFMNRFRPEVETLKAWLAEGLLGDVYHARSVVIRRRGVPGMGGWFTTRAKSGGGALIDIGVHHLDLAMWLLGHPEPVSVSGLTCDKVVSGKPYVRVGMYGRPVPGGRFDVEEYAAGLVRFANGASLWLECSWALNAPDDEEVCLFGDRAGARLTFKDRLALYGEFGGRLADITPQLAARDMYHAELSHFVECLRDGVRPISTAEQGLAAQRVIEAIYESSRSGREVRLDPSPGGPA